MPRKSAKATAKEADRLAKANEALDLRKMGYSYRAIAEDLNVSVSTAHKYIQDALTAITKDSAEQVLTLQLERYDELLTVHYAHALDGDPLATDKALAIMARIERLHGVNGPGAQDGTEKVKSLLEQLLETPAADASVQ